MYRFEYLSEPSCLECSLKIEFSDLGNKAGYHKCFLIETAMVRVKKLLGRRLSLREHNVQINEAYGMMKALNKLTELGMLHTKVIVE